MWRELTYQEKEKLKEFFVFEKKVTSVFFRIWQGFGCVAFFMCINQ